MTAPIHAKTLRDRTREALTRALTRIAPPALARLLECDRSTTSTARGGRARLVQFDAEEFLLLAAYDGTFRVDVVAALTEQVEDGQPLEAESDVRALMRTAARATDQMLGRLADNRLSAAEVEESIPELEGVVAMATKALKDCRARQRCMRGGRR